MGWNDLPPSLPCPDCKHRGWVARKGLHYGCERCRGYGRVFCTIEDHRKVYRYILRLVCQERGMTPEDFNEQIRCMIERIQKVHSSLRLSVWTDNAWFYASKFGLQEKCWHFLELLDL